MDRRLVYVKMVPSIKHGEIAPVTPGELLQEEFLTPMGVRQAGSQKSRPFHFTSPTRYQYSTSGNHNPIAGNMYISTMASICMPMNGSMPAKI